MKGTWRTLLFGPPFDQQVFVEQAPSLMPDSGISSGYRLHSSSMLQLTGTWIRHSCKTNIGLNLLLLQVNELANFCFELSGQQCVSSQIIVNVIRQS